MKPLNHFAWVITRSGDLLHCVPEVIDEGGIWHDDFVDDGGAEASAVCGRRAKFVPPGIFTRMGARRCASCCSVVGIPPGEGTPVNEAAALNTTPAAISGSA